MEGISKRTLCGQLGIMAAKRGEHTFMQEIESGESVSWNTLYAQVQQLAKGYLAMGFQKGDHVLLWSTNSIRWVATVFALSWIGVVPILANTNFKEDEIAYLMEDGDVTAVIFKAYNNKIHCTDIVNRLFPEMHTGGQSRRFPHMRRAVCIDASVEGTTAYEDILAMGEGVSDAELARAAALVSEDDVCVIQYTSGTTGRPKGVLSTHAAALYNAEHCWNAAELTENDILCQVLPLFHSFGFVLSVVVAVHGGYTQVISGGFHPVTTLKMIEQAKATVLFGVPTMFMAMLAGADVGLYDLASLRLCVVAADTCAPEVLTAMYDVLRPEVILNGYGQTEAFSAVTLTRPGDPMDVLLTSVGKPITGVDIRIVDLEDRHPMANYEDGEIQIRGPLVMKGYYKRPEETAKTITEDGWLNTGDIGYLDDNGYLYIKGRCKEVIRRGGESIFPRELELFLMKHPAVQEAYVIGIPSEYYGEEVMACVRLRPGMTATEDEIRMFIKNNFAVFKTPKVVEFYETFPITASGKVQKFEIRNQYLHASPKVR